MRTRVLALTAAASVIGAAAMADVVSVNVVGFVNLSLKSGYNLLVNPLQATNNTVEAIFAGLSDSLVGLTIQQWDAAVQSFSPNIATYLSGGVWDYAGTSYTLEAGKGFFVNSPADATVTFVGEVRQATSGNLVTTLAPNFNFIGSQVPMAGTIQTQLQYVPAEVGDTVQLWVPAQQKYNPVIYTYLGTGTWDPSEPTIGIGEAFVTSRASGGSWTSDFKVQ